MSSRVEIGFDLSGNPDLDFFVLDDSEKGVLDNTEFRLGGVAFFDVTEKVKSFSISRGKSRFLDRYPAGKLSIVFDNNDRTFDPEFAGSPYAGQIIPRREVRVFTDDVIQMEAVIDDWDLEYSPNGNSTASIVASDALTFFANQALSADTQTSQKSGARIIEILNDPEVNWSVDKRVIDTGLQTLQADTVEDGTNVLEYIQRVTASEIGAFYIGKNGFVNFRENFYTDPDNPVVDFTDDGTGIPYKNIQVIYGSELLFNEVVVNILGGGSATSVNVSSQLQYGIINLTLDDLLLDNTTSAQDMADLLVSRYKEPEYRFNSVTIDLDAVTSEQREAILNLDLTSICSVKFTPNNIPPAIEKVTEIIRIEHSVTATSHNVTFGFAALDPVE